MNHTTFPASRARKRRAGSFGFGPARLPDTSPPSGTRRGFPSPGSPCRSAPAELCVALLVLAAAVLPPFATSLALTAGDRPAAHRAAMTLDLERLAHLEERHRSVHGSYSDDPDRLGFHGSEGVYVEVVATATGWAATARHEKIEGAGCAVYGGDLEVHHVGRTPGGLVPHHTGEIQCDA